MYDISRKYFLEHSGVIYTTKTYTREADEIISSYKFGEIELDEDMAAQLNDYFYHFSIDDIFAAGYTIDSMTEPTLDNLIRELKACGVKVHKLKVIAGQEQSIRNFLYEHGCEELKASLDAMQKAS